jgi:large subunit ribosomal protein L14
MIQKQTYLEVADNSGAKELQCFHIIGSTRKRYAYLGDTIICSVKKAIPGGLVKKGDIVTAVIVRTRKENSREDGSYIRFGDNAAVIIKGGEKDDALEPIATRIFGPVAREIKDKGYSRIVSLAPEVL